MNVILFYLQQAPVWEIIGAEFTQSETHTAGGISIRFPRVTRFRDDKDFATGKHLDPFQINDNVTIHT